ncbi:MAG: metal transporter [Acidobacteriota bacterium]|nr:metal transporter [Acidobacteriota bacterium]
MIPDTLPDRWSNSRLAVAALVPLVLLAILVAVILQTRPGDALRGGAVPPVERLAIERARLSPGQIVLPVLNDGPDPVTIAQVIVDDAYWAFEASDGTVLQHLGRTTLRIPYPWVDGEAHLVKVVTSTGTTFEHEIAVAVASPEPGVRYFFTFALIGLYVGVIPVALGLLWFPIASRVGPTGLDVLLAVTLGLLAFLLVDTIGEGLESVAELPSSFQGLALFAAAAAGAWIALDLVGATLRRRRAAARASSSPGAVVALLVAVGIGLHNFGEGLAIGGAFALGEAALGTLLIIGFTLHNTTEGLAIIAPIAKEKPSVATLLRLGAIGGVPTIAGAWLGGLVHSPAIAVLCLGLGAGAIAQVTQQIAKQMAGTRPVMAHLSTAPIALGLLAGFAVMYATGMFVG